MSELGFWFALAMLALAGFVIDRSALANEKLWARQREARERGAETAAE
jgi:hypothetical protein